MFLRNPAMDKYKSGKAISQQLDNNITCTTPDCTNPLTLYKGPGDSKLCRDHQLQLREYGGMARLDKLYSFAKNWECDWCGYDPRKDPWFENPPIPFDDETHKNRAMRSMLVADHIERATDGGGHGKDNVQSLCQCCNTKKTMLNKDYQRGRSNIQIEEVDTE